MKSLPKTDPAPETLLPFHVPDIGEAEIQSVVETLRSGWLTTGPKVKQLEANFARYVGSAHAVAVNSGTAALHLALEAVGVGQGDEVIVPTMTFAATAEVVLYLRAKPVLIDCDAETLNMDASRIESAVTPKTKAILPVHMAGQPCEMEAVLEIARRHGLAVVEDAAHALPAKFKGHRIGTIGDATCFSFYATKTITTGEGGMVTTQNEAYAERIRMMSLHGISRDAWKRYSSEGTWYYEILSAGYKYNMTDIAAAIGIEQLKKCDRLWDTRTKIARTYDRAFEGLEQVKIPVCSPDVQHAWHLYVLRLNLERLTIDRNAFIQELKARGIGSSVHFIPLHLHPFYRETWGWRPEELPEATKVYERILSLPIYPGMKQNDVDAVVRAVKDISRKYRR